MLERLANRRCLPSAIIGSLHLASPRSEPRCRYWKGYTIVSRGAATLCLCRPRGRSVPDLGRAGISRATHPLGVPDMRVLTGDEVGLVKHVDLGATFGTKSAHGVRSRPVVHVYSPGGAHGPDGASREQAVQGMDWAAGNPGADGRPPQAVVLTK